MKQTGWELQKLNEETNVWENQILTMEDKPVVFDTKWDAEKVLRGYSPHLQHGQYRIYEVNV